MTTFLQTPPIVLFLIGNSVPLLLFIRHYCYAQHRVASVELAGERRLQWYVNRHLARFEMQSARKALAWIVAFEGIAAVVLLLGNLLLAL